MMNRTYFTYDPNLRGLPYRAEPRNVLMVTPDYFDVVDVKNVYMEAQAGKINRERAFRQWEALHQIYLSLQKRGFLDEVSVIQGAEGLEDMVFCANQTFPFTNGGNEKVCFLSQMCHDSRKKEVPFLARFFQDKGYQILESEGKISLFEGMGDAIPHPHRRLIYGGYGHRTAPQAYDILSAELQTPIIGLELISDNFYHLDTCFVPLDETSVMLCPQAFSLSSLRLIEKMFPKVIRISSMEAISTFALNAHVLPQCRVAVLQYGTIETRQALLEAGFEVIETDTSEFMKSGGSVFCMKMMYY